MQRHQLRRVLPRQLTDWGGRYLIEGDSDTRWRHCRVVDISSAGAGIKLLGATADEAQDRHILVTVHFRAAVKNTGPCRDGALRVGAQFVDLTEPASAYIESLARLEAYW
jgi:hypothetical protein